MSWRRLRTLVVREVRATLRDPFTVTVLITVPLAALLSFGSVLSTEVHRLPLGVHDASNTAASRRLIADLGQRAFAPRPFPTRAALDRALVAGQVSVALVIPPDFDRGLQGRRPGEPPPEVQVVYDGAEAVLAGNAEGFLRSLVTASGARLTPTERDPAGRGMPPPPGVEVVSRALFNPTLDGIPFMVAGTFGFVLSFLTTLLTAVSVVNERTTGTFEQLQVTPATNVEIVLGKMLPLGAIFTLDVVLMVLVAGFVLGVWPAGNPLFFVGMSAFYVMISLALGLLVSATSSTPQEAVQKTVLLSIPLVQLSGFAFPLRNMPHVLQWLAEIFPATHYIRLSRAIYLRAEGPLALWRDLSALGAFSVALVALTLRSMARRA